MGKITTHEEFTPLKRTKSIIMIGNREEVRVRAAWLDNLEFNIPMNKVFSLKRGLETYTQKYYRRKK